MHCLTCKSETNNPKFCSKSCAATYNNTLGIYNRRKPEGKCRGCNEQISTRKTWCNSCMNMFDNSPPRKSRTFSTGLEGPCPVPLIGGNCLQCNITIKQKSSYCKSCSAKISAKLKNNDKVKKWLEGVWRGGTDYGLSQIIRNYLLKEANYMCQKCGFNTPHPDDGHTILEINHIDGNGLNHSYDNLEVICPNCHALTSTYRGRNLGNGRPVFYVRKTSI